MISHDQEFGRISIDGRKADRFHLVGVGCILA